MFVCRLNTRAKVLLECNAVHLRHTSSTTWPWLATCIIVLQRRILSASPPTLAIIALHSTRRPASLEESLVRLCINQDEVCDECCVFPRSLPVQLDSMGAMVLDSDAHSLQISTILTLLKVEAKPVDTVDFRDQSWFRSRRALQTVTPVSTTLALCILTRAGQLSQAADSPISSSKFQQGTSSIAASRCCQRRSFGVLCDY